MVGTKEIQEKFASMADSELTDLMNQEGHLLTSEGLTLLKTELTSRGIDQELSGAEGIAQSPAISEPYIRNHPLLAYALEQKENGKTNPEILSILTGLGEDEQVAIAVVSEIRTKAITGLKKAELEKLKGCMFFIAGLAINFLPVSPISNRLSLILGYVAILVGMLLFIKGAFYKSRYKKVLLNLHREAGT